MVVGYAFNPSTRETEAEDIWVQGQPGLQSKFQDSQNYTCLEKKQTNKQTSKDVYFFKEKKSHWYQKLEFCKSQAACMDLFSTSSSILWLSPLSIPLVLSLSFLL